jgi:hypothetical protein
MAPKYVANSRAALKELKAALRESRIGGFNVTTDMNEAIFANLTSTGKGIARKLTASQARDLAAIQRISSRGIKASSRSAARTQSQAVNRYGTAMGPDAAQQLAPARAQAAGLRAAAKGSKAGAGLLAKGGDLGLQIQREGVAEAQAGAEYATAAALLYRGKQDAALVAEQRLAIAQQRMEFQQQKALMRFDQKLQEQQAEKGTGEEFQAASAAIAEAALTMTLSQAQGVLSMQQAIYNLGPQAMQKLRAQLATAYPTSDPAGYSVMYAADDDAPKDPFGEPYVYRGSVQETEVRQTVSAAVHQALAGEYPEGGETWTLQGLKDVVYALFLDADGNPKYPNSFIDQALAYAEHVWTNNLGTGAVVGQSSVPGAAVPGTPTYPNRTGSGPGS